MNNLFKKNPDLIYHIARIFLAIILIPSAFISFFMPPSEMGLSPNATQIVENFWATGYLMHIVKSVELIAGLGFLTNRFVKLAAIMITPVILNIIFLAAFTNPEGLFMGVLMAGMLYLIVRQHFHVYRPLLDFK